MSAGDEEHDALRAWRIIERSGVMNHTYLDPSSRRIRKIEVGSHLSPRLRNLTMEQRQLSCPTPRIKRRIYMYNSSSK